MCMAILTHFQREILQATYLLKFRHLIFVDTLYQMSDFFQIKLNIKKKVL